MVGQCKSCGATARLYQFDQCRDCLAEAFRTLRPELDRVRSSLETRQKSGIMNPSSMYDSALSPGKNSGEFFDGAA